MRRRPIEFRAFHAKLNKWIYYTTEDAFYSKVFNEDRSDWWNIGDASLLENESQSTGLRDKNGRKIYEGDILQFKNKMVNIVDAMKWVDDRNGWEIFEPMNRFEVIGNIHESPQLLK